MRPVIATKLFLPRQRPDLVARPRLRELLRRGVPAKLTLVSAPAGFGKTTLLAQWCAEIAAQPGNAVAWLSLDDEDGDPASFWTYAVMALRTVRPDVGTTALDLLATVPLPVEHLVTTLINDLAAAPGELWLVLDDYHMVDGSEIAEGMITLLEHLPPHVHVVLGTRADPALPLSRWRVRGELSQVRAVDLRFTREEASAYLRQIAGLDLTPNDVAALEDRTEGWVAALQLAALSLQGRADASGFIARFAGDDRYVVDYLVEEVLGHQTVLTRAFLLQTAVLDRLTGSLCDAVTGREDGRDMLVSLERSNLFVVALDERREWYRYHHLFADVLRARLLAGGPGQATELHARASRWFERHDIAEEAVKHALAARDVGRAVRLIELAVPQVRRDLQEALLMRWVAALPDDAVRRSPLLSVFAAHQRLASGDLEAVEPRLADAERALSAVPSGSPHPWPDTQEQRTLPATIAVYRAALAQARGDVPGTTEHARRALEAAGPLDHFARGSAHGFLGLAAWARGDIGTAVATFGEAVAALHAAGAVADALNSTVALADMWLVAGRPDTAAKICGEALAFADAGGHVMAGVAADLHVEMSEIACGDGDVDAAARHLDLAATLRATSADPQPGHRWFLAAAMLADAGGHLDEALAHLDRADAAYRPTFLPQVRPLAAVRARVWIRAGDLARALAWAQERGLTPEDEVGYLREYDHLTLARLRLAKHRAEPELETLQRVRALLARLAVDAERSGRMGSLTDIRLVQRWADDPEGRPADAGRGLRRGTPLPDALSERELQVLQLLVSDLTGPEIARVLFVSHNTLRTHTKHIFTKLGVTSRRAAVQRARERGLL